MGLLAMRTSKRVHAFSARNRYTAKTAAFVMTPGSAIQNNNNLLNKNLAWADAMAPGLQKDDRWSDAEI